MAIQNVSYIYRVRINDDDWRIAPDLTINQSVDQMCTVAEFSIAARPSTLPAVGDEVLIDLVDVSAGRMYPIFGGTVNVRRIVAQPWNYRLTCVDQLEKLRRTRTTSDMDLTGMTDGEAWKAIADACDLDYDDDDIADAGYELGEHVAIKWHANNETSGAQMIDELDSVFGMKTITVGHGRIVRLHLDQTPEDGDGLYRSYTKSVNAEFISDQRVQGDRDQLQNAWSVTGPSEEISKSCTAQVWAMAIAGSGYLASMRTRVGEGSFGSDFIQDESLARAIVARQMKLSNRLPDTFSIRVLVDHNIHVGSKLRIVDTTKGIGASAGVYTMVRSLVIGGFWMDLELGAGPGGETGTITSGVQKTCNKTTSDIDRPGDFTEGGFSYPPLDGGGDTDFTFPGETDEDSGETPPPTPIEGCTTDASFADCDGDDSDFCADGSTSTEDLSGTSPADFCSSYLGANRLQTKSFTAGGVGFSSRCQVHVPWREAGGTGNGYYHVTESGAIDYVQTINSDTTVQLIANTETDPDDQTLSTDVIFAAPLQASVSGTVVFNTAGSRLIIGFLAKDSGGNLTADGAYLTIYADPGLTVDTVTAGDFVCGVSLNGCAQGPTLVGNALPNTSFGSSQQNNGGYVASSPAALGVPVSFTLTCDETRKFGWGWTFADTSLGSGYMDHNDYLNQAHGPFPGEPAMPIGSCEDTHGTYGHACLITMNPGGSGTQEEPAIRLYDLVVGHTTCSTNTEFEP